MIRLTLTFLATYLMSACAASTTQGSIEQSKLNLHINNALNECLSVQASQADIKQNIPQDAQQVMVEHALDIQVLQSIGHCACVSAQISIYSDTAETLAKQPSLPLAQTNLTIKQSGMYQAKLGTQSQLAVNPEIILSLRCAAPE